MTDAVQLALLRGAFQQLKAFCESRPRPDGCVCDVHCPLVSVCGTYLEYDGLDEFADDMMQAITYLQGFSARTEEATE